MKEKKSNKPTTLSKHTRKTSKQITHQQNVLSNKVFIDEETGERIESTQILHKGHDINFDRIFLGHVMETIVGVGNKKIKFLMYLFSIRNSENQVIKTVRTMAEETGISQKTISDTIRALKDNDFLKTPQSGLYVINPNMIFKGSSSKRLNLMLSYEEIETGTETTTSKVSENPDVDVITEKEVKND